MIDPLIREAFELWPAWCTIVGHISRSDPRDACPQSVYGSALATDRDRLAALLYAHHHGESMSDANALLTELLAMAKAGRRPRFGRECGLTREGLV